MKKITALLILFTSMAIAQPADNVTARAGNDAAPKVIMVKGVNNPVGKPQPAAKHKTSVVKSHKQSKHHSKHTKTVHSKHSAKMQATHHAHKSKKSQQNINL